MTNPISKCLKLAIGFTFRLNDNDFGIIVIVLKREQTLYRKKSGTVADKQTFLSYVDKAFIGQIIDKVVNILEQNFS